MTVPVLIMHILLSQVSSESKYPYQTRPVAAIAVGEEIKPTYARDLPTKEV
jgi:hypothetical protein